MTAGREASKPATEVGMVKSGNVKTVRRTRHGGCGTLTYARWKSMMARCHNPKATNFQYYGAQGIVVCDRWHEFAVFLADVGECPGKEMTLDRIKNELGYEPGNCRWATKATQNANRTSIVNLTLNGATKSIAQWAKETGLKANNISMRLRLGWTVEDALTVPTMQHGKKHGKAQQAQPLLQKADHV